MPAPLLKSHRLETPTALVDLKRARRNARRVSEYAASHGLRWRPHIKTHKSREVARIQLEEGAQGLTVATLREAEVMAGVCDDLLLAYPPVGEEKVRRLAGLVSRAGVQVAVDSAETADEAARAGRAGGRDLGVLVEVDVGMGRTGLPAPEQAAELAVRIAGTEGLDFRGILFYPGHIRVPAQEQDSLLREVSGRLEGVMEALASRDLVARVVSGGSTPTLWRSHEISHLTEIRAGTAIFHDRDSVALGAGGMEDVAYHILATVVSTAVPGQAVVDAGSKALSKEEFRTGGEGYGILQDRPEVRVSGLSEEHGILDLSGTSWRPKVGDRVRIVPNHVCVSVNLQDRLLSAEGDRLRWVELEARGRLPWREAPEAHDDEGRWAKPFE